MPGHLQEGFGCIVTNRFDQLLDDESDPFEVIQAAESRKKESTGGGGGGGGGHQGGRGGGGGGGGGGQAAQTNSSSGGGSGPAGSGGGSGSAAKQLRRESQKERKNPLPPFAAASGPGGAGERREDGGGSGGQPGSAPLRKEGIRRIGRRPDQQQPQGEGKPIERRQERRPPRERRFDKPAEEKGEGGEFSVDKPIIDRPMRGRGGPGGRGGRGGRGRGMGRGDGFDSRGKREFDRHSGSDRSGLKPEDKRGGSGSHNWGTVKDELTDLDQSNVTEETPEGEEHPPADSENKENEVEEVKEEGPKEMTLDEWKAIQNKDRAKVEFNIRKPNEGADGQWKKGFVLHKSKSEETKGMTEMQGSQLESNESHAEDSVMDHHFRKPANDITSQLEINFGDLGRPGRGGRGGGRGRGRGGRANRGSRTDKLVKEFDVIHTPNQSSASAPDVDDPEAFPALS